MHRFIAILKDPGAGVTPPPPEHLAGTAAFLAGVVRSGPVLAGLLLLLAAALLTPLL
jgi:hypothetical protein